MQRTPADCAASFGTANYCSCAASCAASTQLFCLWLVVDQPTLGKTCTPRLAVGPLREKCGTLTARTVPQRATFARARRRSTALKTKRKKFYRAPASTAGCPVPLARCTDFAHSVGSVEARKHRAAAAESAAQLAAEPRQSQHSPHRGRISYTSRGDARSH